MIGNQTLDGGRTCEFSPCRKYRYTLWREWGCDLFDGDGISRDRGYLMVIGLNPSIADETQDDPTIRRCIDFARRWGFGALCMTNLFAWRDTLPENMKKASDPIGPMNDAWLRHSAENAGLILAAWGVHGAHLGREAQVRNLIHTLQCLGVTKDGAPKHPLYIKADTKPVQF